jgi:hypothetical protein
VATTDIHRKPDFLLGFHSTRPCQSPHSHSSNDALHHDECVTRASQF